MELIIMKFSPLYSYLVLFRLKYSPLHPILKHPQATFLPQSQGPSFTPIQNRLKASNVLPFGNNKQCDSDTTLHRSPGVSALPNCADYCFTLAAKLCSVLIQGDSAQPGLNATVLLGDTLSFQA
jgi:hypothetical protein